MSDKPQSRNLGEPEPRPDDDRIVAPGGPYQRTSFVPERPGPQPHNAGVTPGWKHVGGCRRAGRFRRLMGQQRDAAAVVAMLVDEVAALRSQLAERGGGR